MKIEMKIIIKLKKGVHPKRALEYQKALDALETNGFEDVVESYDLVN